MKRAAAASFPERLLAWFDRHGRKDLPWQRDPDPYRVWLSEIMLQQTRVATVVPYFRRFVARFPDVEALAAASLDEVLQLWSGLGYYARARNLHRTAQIVSGELGGRFPEDLEALRALPGIGRSTAGAVLALARGQRHPILDGNVKRVLCRYHGIDEWPGRPAIEKRLWSLADSATPQLRVGDYTQAIMDLGATLCTRTRPDCGSCPFDGHCHARRELRPTAYPAPKPAKQRPKRSASLLLLTNPGGEILLERRPPSGIWGGLWSLPEIPDGIAGEDALRRWCAEQLCCRIDGITTLPEIRHGFTHFELTIHPLHARAVATGRLMEGDRYLWYNGARRDSHGMAAPIRRLINQWLDSQEAGDGPQGQLRQTG